MADHVEQRTIVVNLDQFIDMIRDGDLDPWIEKLLSELHGRKLAIRKVKGFVDESNQQAHRSSSLRNALDEHGNPYR